MKPSVATDLIVNVGKESIIEETEKNSTLEERNLETSINTLMLMKRVKF